MTDKTKRYIRIGSIVVIAGITCYIMRGRIAGLALRGPDGLETADTLVTNRSLFSIFSPHDMTTVIIREGRGHPGYLVHNITTDQYYRSQNVAAKCLGVSDSHVSNHLNGMLSHVAGNHLERVTVA